ncbi:hypothetical protein WUBG_04715 [Wuchereria bancrofti]|uniref:GMIP/FCHO2-like FCH domain-containing protein n=1 Tax=Wuchereria bancrofti TaxID=6293 RepID=J9EQ93_WUCBA|nr:hypothetical protein WUBG_04715 [Wuchereria bancrofti]
MVATAVDYTEHFWGEKHHGYHVLYENLKHEEESVQELAQFIKERAAYEEEWNKFLNKCIAKTNGLIAPGSMQYTLFETKHSQISCQHIMSSFYGCSFFCNKHAFEYSALSSLPFWLSSLICWTNKELC